MGMRIGRSTRAHDNARMHACVQPLRRRERELVSLVATVSIYRRTHGTHWRTVLQLAMLCAGMRAPASTFIKYRLRCCVSVRVRAQHVSYTYGGYTYTPHISYMLCYQCVCVCARARVREYWKSSRTHIFSGLQWSVYGCGCFMWNIVSMVLVYWIRTLFNWHQYLEQSAHLIQSSSDKESSWQSE